MATDKLKTTALRIVERPSFSPHRVFLRTVNLCGGAGADVYHLQERKLGASRGTSPVWTGEFDAEALAVMREIERRWGAYQELVDVLGQIANVDDDHRIGTVRTCARQVLRKLGEAA